MKPPAAFLRVVALLLALASLLPSAAPWTATAPDCGGGGCGCEAPAAPAPRAPIVERDAGCCCTPAPTTPPRTEGRTTCPAEHDGPIAALHAPAPALACDAPGVSADPARPPPAGRAARHLYCVWRL